MIIKILIFVLIFGLTAINVFGDYLLKLAGQSKRINWRYIVIGAILWALVALGWFVVYRKIKFSSAGFLYGIISSILLMMVGTLIFHEQINAYEKIGIVLAIISFILLAKFA
ncbi:MAG: hypothetical protein A3A94_01180 [Candidatus Portnoybacteria bacterium RIFCSPLOWO2_01_FULL_43_11]|uniref:EamA domain-containing protein n=4 Tax=Bacteria candidate phyla TaxID=1783234 RepID=A0A1G2FT92_9BACT|nr:MAG: hypothetical protein A2713_01685 [candidate division WWE3 bacterium RIFCSPHIGHO2_01_FULL_35_17]OGZ38122.1 MAG: hypothetical protein A3A94_01180 [Candidatus Portnoybacteria bacterium RIFCSPLOWO2_01_FULL_43_11]OGZ38889.1 MAG: hypothetical protein A3E90_02320 [Candidatus Portnoybacteria bacterium RIFCSPHIGHO2_12_FULL_40_11]OGZ40860.1 MAG: hypothetical protein A3I20_02545 [Candidatus Portnoybacteria bacterium RIFCSPLOWO2_02_FULL_40_15]